jgi:hypothetical protein
LQLRCDKPDSHFAFEFNLRRYIMDLEELMPGQNIVNVRLSGRPITTDPIAMGW